MEGQLLTVQQVAYHLGITHTTVYSLIARGKLSVTKVGRLTRISPTSLSAYVEKNTRQTATLPNFKPPRSRFGR